MNGFRNWETSSDRLGPVFRSDSSSKYLLKTFKLLSVFSERLVKTCFDCIRLKNIIFISQVANWSGIGILLGVNLALDISELYHNSLNREFKSI